MMRGGMGNMNNMMKQMQKMQKDMAKAQEELGEKQLKVQLAWNDYSYCKWSQANS